MVPHGPARLRRYDSVVACDISPGHAESFTAEAAALTNASVQVIRPPAGGRRHIDRGHGDLVP